MSSSGEASLISGLVTLVRAGIAVARSRAEGSISAEKVPGARDDSVAMCGAAPATDI